MKRKFTAAVCAAALAFSLSGCAFDEMLSKLDSTLETADSSKADSADEAPAEENSTSTQPDTQQTLPPAESVSSSETAESSSSDEDEQSIDEMRFTANARAVVSSWFDLMSAAQYTDAFTLCTEDFVKTYYPEGLVDGTNASPASVTYYEGAEEFDTDELGRKRVKLKISITPEMSIGSTADGYMFVVLDGEGKFLISGASKIEDAGFSDETDESDVELYARLIFESARVYNEFIEAGVYTTGDGSYLDKVLPEYVPGGKYVIYVGENGVESAEYTADGLTAKYP
ncbi:MAG: hypothetical protein J6M17_01060 [Ruminococcus sp.]|nr:hypothetical protein [Ruminococcus sp.]